MAQHKTPGVYPVEEAAFPNSVVEVATAVPAFIGYTARAKRGTRDLKNVPTRVSSLAEYELLFGGAPAETYGLTNEDGALTLGTSGATRFLLYYGLRMFFDNGGGPCWIVSVGTYAETTQKSPDHFTDAWPNLVKEQEPTMIVVPDAVLLDLDSYVGLSNAALSHCATLTSRVAILDVFNGDQARTHSDDDVISGDNGFRQKIEHDKMSYGIAYYPWINTNVLNASNVTYANLNADGLDVLHAAVAADDTVPESLRAQLTLDLDKIKEPPASETDLTRLHQKLAAVSEVYRQVMADILHAMNVLPPSAAMAGVLARTDNIFGVFRAPANTGITGAMSPTVTISHDDQMDLNVPLDGKAINAIRTFLGRGVLVWGARTLDGNSQDWRYVNARRTLIILEQSISIAAQAYVFAPNDAGTWQTMRTMIENFLNNQWKAGALVGAKPDDAYQVSVGLGSTMTANDILDGYMRVTVKLAIVRPAEFIVITFQQKMQTS